MRFFCYIYFMKIVEVKTISLTKNQMGWVIRILGVGGLILMITGQFVLGLVAWLSLFTFVSGLVYLLKNPWVVIKAKKGHKVQCGSLVYDVLDVKGGVISLRETTSEREYTYNPSKNHGHLVRLFNYNILNP